jgi:hypothetical protein
VRITEQVSTATRGLLTLAAQRRRMMIVTVVAALLVVGAFFAGRSFGPTAPVAHGGDAGSTGTSAGAGGTSADDLAEQKRLLDDANGRYLRSDMRGALDAANAAVAKAPDSEDGARALLLRGKIQQAVGSLADAKASYAAAMSHPRAQPTTRSEAANLRFLLP